MGATTSSRLTRRVASLLLTPVAAAALVGMILPGTASAAQVTIVPGDVTFEQWRSSGNWSTGNLTGGYAEGDVVPFRVTITDAGNSAPGDTFTFSICRDFENDDDPAANGYLFIDDYDTTVSPDLEGATRGNTINGVTAAGDGATVTILSVVDDNTPTGGDCGSEQRETEVVLTVSGLSGNDEAYVLWGGHAASPFDEGVTVGASAYSGSSLHMTFFPSKTLSGSFDGAPAGTLTVKKDVDNDFGGTLTPADFPLFVNGEPVTTGVATTLPAGTYTVSETQQAGYAGGAFSGACAPSGTVTLGDDQNLTCTITNHDVAPRLTVIKHVENDDGGTLDAGDFTMNVTGTDVSAASFPGDEAGTTVTLDAGTYSVAETGPAGYSGSLDNGCSGTIGIGQSATCIITNDDQAASLTVIKNVINDNGGLLTAAAFTMNVTGTDVSAVSFPGSGTGTTVTLDAGAYSVSEGTVAGYTPSYSADCAGTIGVGQSRTCTVTNDDVAPNLTVIKNVINNNGGTLAAGDFTLNVAGANVSDGSFPGSGTGTTVSLDAGVYSVTEDTEPGYTPSYSADCAGTIGVGQSRTCTVTNDDVAPTLTVIKTVVNNNGGTLAAGDFTLNVAGAKVSDGSFPGSGTGTTVSLDAGAYSVTENTAAGYTPSFSNGCAGTIGVGEARTCTVTNDDIAVVVPPVEPTPGHIVIRKVTLPTPSTQPFQFTADYDADGFSLAAGSSIDSGELRPDTYSVAETAAAGWNLTTASCDDGSNPASINLGAGETVTCTFTNTRIPEIVTPPPTEIESNTETPNVPVEIATVTAVPPATVPKATEPVTIPQTSPITAEELPRTGAGGMREETLLGLFLMLAGLLARGVGRRTRPQDI